jgi:hypothetical protein
MACYGYRITPDDRRLLRTAERNSVAAKIVKTYIAGLSEAGALSPAAQSQNFVQCLLSSETSAICMLRLRQE